MRCVHTELHGAPRKAIAAATAVNTARFGPNPGLKLWQLLRCFPDPCVFITVYRWAVKWSWL